jgi:hypothetical protein
LICEVVSDLDLRLEMLTDAKNDGTTRDTRV